MDEPWGVSDVPPTPGMVVVVVVTDVHDRVEQSGRRMRRARRQDVGRAVAHVPAVFAGVRCGVGREVVVQRVEQFVAAVRAGHPFPVPYPPTRHPGSPWRKTKETRFGPPMVGLLAERPQMPPPAGPS